ncbi:MAG: hypothetical protein ABSD56_08890 [Bryobacteraceae bacterium]
MLAAARGDPAELAEVAALLSDRAIAAGVPLPEDQTRQTAPPIAPAPEAQPADVGEFLEARTERIYQGWATSRAMRAAYLTWASERQLPALGRSAFCQALKAAGLRTSRSRRDVNGKQARTWEGARLLPEC